MDVDTRLLRYFAAVAAEGNLTRAAERLFVSQPALTKQIKQLESQLGVRLFTRSRAGMTLTAAGQALADEIPAVLAELGPGAAGDQGRRQPRGPGAAGRIHVQRRQRGHPADHRGVRPPPAGLAGGHATGRLVGPHRRARRAATSTSPCCGCRSPARTTCGSRCCSPSPAGSRCPPPTRSPRATRSPSGELWDEPFVAAPAETGWWRDYWLATDERQGHPVRIGAVTDQPDAWLTAIANGDGIALVPESAARYYARPGITYRPVTGVSPSQVGVAWPPADDTNPVVQDFVRCCLDNKPPT